MLSYIVNIVKSPKYTLFYFMLIYLIWVAMINPKEFDYQLMDTLSIKIHAFMYSLGNCYMSPCALKYRSTPNKIHNAFLLFIGIISHWFYLLNLICIDNPMILWNILQKSGSPWVSALVLYFDLWSIKQLSTTIKTDFSPMANVASSACKHNQSTGMWHLFHWSFVPTNHWNVMSHYLQFYP